jgi:hypothetical protein
MLLIFGNLPNEIWRVLGFLAGRKLDEGAEVLIWVRAVATAIVGCVVMQVLIVPPGALASVPALVRCFRLSSAGLSFIFWSAARCSPA